MARNFRSNTRSSSRLEQTGSTAENPFARAVDKAAPGAPRNLTTSILGDITNIARDAAPNLFKAVASGGLLSGRSSVPEPAARATPRETHQITGDETDTGNPQYVAEYILDIYGNLREEEARDQIRPDFLEVQQEVTSKMRAILVDWLVEVCMKYKLKSETLFLAVNLLDRFLARKSVTRKRLQLVGIVAILVAAKFEEIYPPEIRELVYICDKAYTKDDIVQMELAMLTVLEFKLRVPTAVQFLDRCMKGCNETHRALSQYIAELSLTDARMVRFSPSLLAASTTYLGAKLLKQKEPWPAAQASCTGYPEASLKACAKELCALVEAAPSSPQQAVRKKFSTAKMHNVAKLTF